jgi:hypothetical protein
LEENHRYIQLLFPTNTISPYNPDAFLVTKKDQELFNYFPELRANLRYSLDVMLYFYGFTYNRSLGRIIKNKIFESRRRVWLTKGNHNFSRLTRILTSLGLLGLKLEGQILFIALCDIYKEYPSIVGSSITFWKESAKNYLS